MNYRFGWEIYSILVRWTLTVKENGAKRGKQITLSSVGVLNEYVIFRIIFIPLCLSWTSLLILYSTALLLRKNPTTNYFTTSVNMQAVESRTRHSYSHSIVIIIEFANLYNQHSKSVVSVPKALSSAQLNLYMSGAKRFLFRSLKTESTFFRHNPVTGSHISGKRNDCP